MAVMCGGKTRNARGPRFLPLSPSRSLARARSLSPLHPSVRPRPSLRSLVAIALFYMDGGRERETERESGSGNEGRKEGREGGRKAALPRSCARSRAPSLRSRRRQNESELGGKEGKERRPTATAEGRERVGRREGGRKTCTIRVSGLN